MKSSSFLLRLRNSTPTTTSLLPLACIIPRRSASTTRDKISATESIRRKIWGTDEPPGQADPYGDASLLDRTKQLSQEPEVLESKSTSEQDEKAEKTAAYADYVPATTWDGLDHIGGATGWWEEAWDEEHQFEGFMTVPRTESLSAVKEAVQRAVVEVFTLENAKTSLEDASPMPMNDNVNTSQIKVLELTSPQASTDSRPSDAQQNTQDPRPNNGENTENQALSAMQQEGEALSRPLLSDLDSGETTNSTGSDVAQASVTGTSETFELEAVADETWFGLSLQDPMMKFAVSQLYASILTLLMPSQVLKRAMQLTGRRIADPTIDHIKVVGDLVEHLTEKPKPKKLAEVLVAKPELASVPNVQIYERRYTPIDKEKEVGRWKVIERELQKRGLPVTGRAKVTLGN
ncbi:hypothetical protein MMC13_005845 [Lambiella insularis]|nr:hypothetical protein [Lambiella insularis]